MRVVAKTSNKVHAMTDIYHETLARRMGFKPLHERTPEEQASIHNYCNKYYDVDNSSWYYWKESTVGDGNWISYDCEPHNRIAAPHLRSKSQSSKDETKP
jgi:hypothetical protein